MRVFAFAAALRRDSFNRKLIRLAAQAVERAGAHKLRERFLGADAFDNVVGGFVAFAGALANRA